MVEAEKKDSIGDAAVRRRAVVKGAAWAAPAVLAASAAPAFAASCVQAEELELITSQDLAGSGLLTHDGEDQVIGVTGWFLPGGETVPEQADGSSAQDVYQFYGDAKVPTTWDSFQEDPKAHAHGYAYANFSVAVGQQTTVKLWVTAQGGYGGNRNEDDAHICETANTDVLVELLEGESESPGSSIGNAFRGFTQNYSDLREGGTHLSFPPVPDDKTCVDTPIGFTQTPATHEFVLDADQSGDYTVRMTFVPYGETDGGSTTHYNNDDIRVYVQVTGCPVP